MVYDGRHAALSEEGTKSVDGCQIVLLGRCAYDRDEFGVLRMGVMDGKVAV